MNDWPTHPSILMWKLLIMTQGFGPLNSFLSTGTTIMRPGLSPTVSTPLTGAVTIGRTVGGVTPTGSGAAIPGLMPLLPPIVMRQILGNLILNAIKYRDRAKPVGWIELAFDAAGAGRWRVSVEDNGLGIAPADQERIFEEFQRVTPREEVHGTGLGLAIVRRLTELLGGQVRVRSELGRGSRFELELPEVAQHPPAGRGACPA
jgi:signal transduction histidine kinase